MTVVNSNKFKHPPTVFHTPKYNHSSFLSYANRFSPPVQLLSVNVVVSQCNAKKSRVHKMLKKAKTSFRTLFTPLALEHI